VLTGDRKDQAAVLAAWSSILVRAFGRRGRCGEGGGRAAKGKRRGQYGYADRRGYGYSLSERQIGSLLEGEREKESGSAMTTNFYRQVVVQPSSKGENCGGREGDGACATTCRLVRKGRKPLGGV